MRNRWFALFLVSVTAVANVGFALTSAASVEVARAYVPEPPPGQMNAAMFMTLKNVGAETLTLSSVECSFAAHCYLHAQSQVDGKVSMRRLAALELKPGAEIELRPGGMHVMLVGLKAGLKSGDDVQLTLRFANGGATVVKAQVRDLRR